MTPLKKKKRINLRKERIRNHKITLNILIVGNKNITQKTITRNLNKMGQQE
jgi:hypothetical protein